MLLSLANAHLENVCEWKICSVNFFYLRKNARHAEQHKISAVLVRPFRAWLAKHSWQKVHDPTRLDRFDLTTHQQKSLSHSTTDTHITHTHTAATAETTALCYRCAACTHVHSMLWLRWVQIAARTRTCTLAFALFLVAGQDLRCVWLICSLPLTTTRATKTTTTTTTTTTTSPLRRRRRQRCAALTLSLLLLLSLWLSEKFTWALALIGRTSFSFVFFLLFLCLISCQLAHLLDALPLRLLSLGCPHTHLAPHTP